MSRKNNKARRLARKERAPSKQFTPSSRSEPWGQGPPLTPQERAHALSRFTNMRFRNFTVSFVPVFGADVWFKAKNPDELNEAARSMLFEMSKGQLKN